MSQATVSLTTGPLTLSGGPVTCVPTRPAAQINLRLIATTDLHACLTGHDHHANRPASGFGLYRISRQIAAARAEVANALLFDNGDFLQGTPLADYAATARRRGRPHPVVTAFNALRYDAITLGNHEFNYGLPFLRASLASARFPVVSANIATRLGKSPARDTTLVPPFTVLTRTVTDTDGRSHRLRIGVIGFAPPQIEVWDRDHLASHIQVRDILASARAWLPRLKARGVDLIVALAHSGIGPADVPDGAENAATALAAMPEIDAVIAGHSHLAFPGPQIAATRDIDPMNGTLCGKPAVMPGHSGSHIGLIDLTLTPSRCGPSRWLVRTAAARLEPASGRDGRATTDFGRALAPDHRAALAWSRRVIGSAAVPLHTHFATLAPSAAMTLIAEAKIAYARRALAGTEWADLPVLAGAAPFRAGGRGGAHNFTDIPAGPLRMRSISDLYLFPNKLVTLLMTGADMADWLEQSAALFHRVTPGAVDAPLHDSAVPGFTFETVTGLGFAIDLSQPARFDAQGALADPSARRIVGLSREGHLVRPDDRFLLVTNNHRASRAAAHAPLGTPAPRTVLADGVTVQTVLCDHIRAAPRVGAPPGRSWHFLPMPGTSVTVTAGHGSEAHLADIAAYRPQPLGPCANGFSHYRLHL
ncbi:bifunctional 2',3'-cyclic-nucleotide 2'-phosphodiesterase/3'-nucleotidase [Tabrizicola sp. BL-A-41-H6]|uniref:bifunctional 2',3'-cyclic-nucleotide 2'-phosphodiesterase/3'-nucleotidase n=1 Tax=Tabrizicola sp. BL-A-41-H6 TaxID=3421107 RepID=UPI003D671D2D